MKSINVIKTSILFLLISLVVILGLEVLFEYLLYSEIKLTFINLYFILAFISIMSLVFFTFISKIIERYNSEESEDSNDSYNTSAVFCIIMDFLHN